MPPPLDEPIQTIEQQFDSHCEVVFDMLGKFPAKLVRLRNHTTRQAYVVYELNSEISDLSSIIEEYTVSLSQKLIIRNAVHRQCAAKFESLLDNIGKTSTHLAQIKFETDDRNCK